MTRKQIITKIQKAIVSDNLWRVRLDVLEYLKVASSTEDVSAVGLALALAERMRSDRLWSSKIKKPR